MRWNEDVSSQAFRSYPGFVLVEVMMVLYSDATDGGYGYTKGGR